MSRRRRIAPVLAARRHRSATVLMGIVVLLLAAAWTAHHAVVAFKFDARTSSQLTIVWAVLFLVFILQTFMYHLERVPKLTPRTARQLADKHVAILVPVYNEDPGLLKKGLESFLNQTRMPDSVHIVDDGSKNSDYADVRAWWAQAARQAKVATTWQRVPNGGKRHAQAHAVRVSPDAQIYITCDSDSCFAPSAVEQILIPFIRPRVQAVAGIVVALNIRANLLVRITDLWFVVCQLVDRSGQSAVGAVMVNSGPLAAYRAEIIRDNLGSYLNETFRGRPVMFSDDSLLTLYAQSRGLTVQQPSAICFTAMPEKWSHFSRMYLRWMRGSTIRSIWRARYLPVNRPAYWLHAMRWLQMILTQMVTVWILIVQPVVFGNVPPATMLAIPFLIGYAQGLRYLSIIRSDERIRYQFATWLMMPLAIIMAWTHLRFLRWYGIFTCGRTGWGTRQNGAEVSLDAADAAPAPAVIPYVKSVDPMDESTLQIPQIRQQSVSPY
ncbi:glycosyltransferase [Streptomyces sp. NBC_01242]|uniref:glycosyltransferase n=1 Tax=Streptomyces sp. NBC_01242 TaxID=2903795 RepID=UPI00225C1FA5|nr:glycosyltransferase [Streptomyces sp. NBC_01242]MCX4799578.1 glycosyltransferase [Streptomyces sp. NBC_01242]